MTRRTTLFTLLTFLLFTASVAAQDYQVVVNSSNSMGSISKVRLSRIFLKKTRSWDNGNRIVPVDQVKRASVRAAFTDAVHNKSVGQVSSYWQEQIFSGRSSPPAELSSNADVLRFVRENPSAIGYVAAGASVGSGVKTVTVTD